MISIDSEVTEFVDALKSISYTKGTPWVKHLARVEAFLRESCGNSPTASQLVLWGEEHWQVEIMGGETAENTKGILERAVQQDRFCANAYVALGRISMIGAPLEAVEFLEVACVLQPTIENFKELADALVLACRFEEAHAVLDRLDQMMETTKEELANLRSTTPEGP